MGMTREIFKDKALSLLLGERFLDLPLFESENIEDYRLSDEQGDMCFKDFLDHFYTLLAIEKWIKAEKLEEGMTIADLIRNMSDEELAQMMIDIAYENTPIEDGETYMRIPSPIGGYLVDGIIDLHDTDVVVDALQEEVEDGNEAV